MTVWLAKLAVSLLALVATAMVLVFSDRLLAPLSRRGRWLGGLFRFLPLLALGLLAAEMVYVIVLVAALGELYSYATLSLLVVALLAMFALVRDVLAGVWLRMENSLRPGLIVGLGPSRGRIRSLGVRSFDMEVSDGSIERVPYSVAARGRIARIADDGGISAHRVRLALNEQQPDVMLERARQIVLNHACTPIRRPPVIKLISTAAGLPEMEVTLYAASVTNASRVEIELRRAFEQPAVRI